MVRWIRRAGEAMRRARSRRCCRCAVIHQDEMHGDGRSRCRDNSKNVAVCKQVMPRASVGIVRSIAMLLSVAA